MGASRHGAWPDHAGQPRRVHARAWRSLVPLGLAALILPAVSLADPPPADVTASSLSANRYLAGARVQVDTPVRGDLLAAGGEVRVESRVQADAMVAGGSVQLRAPVGGDARLAGGEVTVAGDVGGELAAAGGNVTVPAATTIGGPAWLSGGRVELAGAVRGPLRVVAGDVRLTGAVGGDVDITAQDIEIAAGARIDGRLRYRSGDAARIDPGAHIAGGVERLPLPTPPPGPWVQTGVSVAKVLAWLGVVLLGVIVLALMPHTALAAARTTAHRPFASLLIGFALLVTVPVAAVLLMISIVGLPLAFALLALYSLALMLAWITAAVAIGDLGARVLRPVPSRTTVLAAFAVGLLLLWLLGYVPIVGGVVRFIALLLGLGAWAVYLHRRLDDRTRPPTVPA